jgi:hypothetical protein
MSKGKRRIEESSHDLQLDEKLSMHEAGWVAQAIGLTFIFFIVLSAAAGLYGEGPLSKRIEKSPNATLEYQRFNRYQHETELKVNIQQTNGVVTVAIPNDYLEQVEIKSIQPEPKSNKIEGGYVKYSFEGSGTSNITFFIKPQNYGAISGGVDVNDQRFLFNQFIFP